MTLLEELFGVEASDVGGESDAVFMVGADDADPEIITVEVNARLKDDEPGKFESTLMGTWALEDDCMGPLSFIWGVKGKPAPWSTPACQSWNV